MPLVGFEPTIPVRDADFQSRCVCHFRHRGCGTGERQTSREELAEALLNLTAHAKRQQCIIGHDSAWDRAHQRLDELLDEMQAAS